MNRNSATICKASQKPANDPISRYARKSIIHNGIIAIEVTQGTYFRLNCDNVYACNLGEYLKSKGYTDE